MYHRDKHAAVYTSVELGLYSKYINSEGAPKTCQLSLGGAIQPHLTIRPLQLVTKPQNIIYSFVSMHTKCHILFHYSQH